MEKNIKEAAYSVKGMHCASCEILIEKKLLEIKEINFAEASTQNGQIWLKYEGKRPVAKELSDLFIKEGYIFSNISQSPIAEDGNKNLFSNFAIAIIIISGFLFLNNLRISGLINANSYSSLPTFFILGILAGASSCAALVGGIILSMSKQWTELYKKDDTTFEKLRPHLMFNAGRILSYGVLGAGLGLIGSAFQISFKFASLLTIAVSVMMFFLALQMLGIKAFRRFQFTLPKFASRHIADEKNFAGKYMPFIMGALTFFLPCGFTITAQGLALLSGNALQGTLIMLFFALGTMPILLTIGLSSIKLFSQPHLALRFSKIAGFLVLFFALFNINSQLNVLGYASFSDLISPAKSPENGISVANENGFPPIINGVQVIKMNASSSGYSPNYFKLRTGVPVRWEVTDTGTSGCTNAVISKNLFDGPINLTPGKTSIKEFTPSFAGKYKFSCWMGMVSGTIEVINASGSNAPTATLNGSFISKENAIPSDSSACGCSGQKNYK